jgi:ribonuclease HI
MKKKYYVVWKGATPGIYDNWESCKHQIQGFQGAVYKSFPTRKEAEDAYKSNAFNYFGKKKSWKDLSPEEKESAGIPVLDSVSVDAACSGNPGIMEYRGVITGSGIELFHEGKYEDATVNIGEFLAIVHALALLKKKKQKFIIYSDSKTAMKWVKDKKANTKLIPTAKNRKVFNLLSRAEKWLVENNHDIEIRKWKTDAWGEIPADFGRK